MQHGTMLNITPSYVSATAHTLVVWTCTHVYLMESYRDANAWDTMSRFVVYSGGVRIIFVSPVNLYVQHTPVKTVRLRSVILYPLTLLMVPVIL